jgi:hypothetical protein
LEDPAAEDIRTDREFMDALRVLRARSGLSYRDIAVRMSRVAPRQAMAKSTLATLFAQDMLPRRPGQVTAIVNVLAAELAESGDLTAFYLGAWTRLMTARSVQTGETADASQQDQASPPAVPTAVAASLPVPPQARYPAQSYYQATYWEPRVPLATHARAESEPEPPGSIGRLLVNMLGVGTILSVITWLPFIGTGVSFWWIWLCCCGCMLLVIPFALLTRGPRASSTNELPADYAHYEHHRATEHRPSWY